MKRNSLVIYWFFCVISFGAIACSSNAPAPQSGTGGQGAGGVTASGGKPESGGANTGGMAGNTQTGSGGTSSGGSLATGGSPTSLTGGMTNTGGSVGKGGTTIATGGAGGDAGSIATGGTGPASGGNSLADAGRDGTAPGTGGRDGGAFDGQMGSTGGRANIDGSVSGSGGSSSVNPCKASPCIILPLGDSITHGFNSTDDGGYRTALFKLIVAANQNVTFIGSLSNGPSTVSGKTFPKMHEGHDGISITGITGYVPPKKAFSTTPHIVLVHIGTNDMTSNADPTTAANQLDTLVTNLVAAAPEALIVVAKIVPLGYNSANYTSYIAKIPDVVKAHAAKNQNVIMVEMSTLPASDIRGGGNVHPTDQGYVDMGTIWYNAIKGYLP